MTIKRKILIGYGVIFLITSLILGLAITNLVSLGKATDAILSENYRSILAAENMVDSLERQDSAVLLIFLGQTPSGIEQFRENEALFIRWLARAQDNITIPGEEELVNAIKTDYDSYRKLFSGLTDFSLSKTASEFSVYQKEIFPVFGKVREECIKLRNLNEEVMYSSSIKAHRVADKAIWSTSILGLSAILFALIFSFILSERIVSPLKNFMEASKQISRGNYNVQIPVETSDELGKLAGEFNRMASQLCEFHELNIGTLISEKNKNEAIINSMQDGLLVLDGNLKITGINPAACKILSIEANQVINTSCLNLLHDPLLIEQLKAASENKLKQSSPEEPGVVTLGNEIRPRHFLFSIMAVCGKTGYLASIILLLRDITRFRELEKLKSDFIMAASHELRSPLTSLGMSIDLLMESNDIGQLKREKELLQTACEETQRLKALINDLLDLSRLEAGKIELEFENIAIFNLFEQIEKVFKGQIALKGISLTTECPNDLPEVRVDANKVAWVMTNLVSNAMRYVEKNGQIRLKAALFGTNIHISVQDDGPGIPLEYQSKIFQKFVQVKGRASGGAGLGLAICREIVKAHSGTIWVDSEPGKGSTFTFTLPLPEKGDSI